MTQRSLPARSQDLQIKQMAAIDAAWKTIETSDAAAVVRKVEAMVAVKQVAIPAPALAEPAIGQVEVAPRALDRLKGGRRGRV
jgi:hypothetical protein